MRTILIFHWFFFVWKATTTLVVVLATRTDDNDSSIPVGGWGDWTYEYDPTFLPLPPQATLEHAHGIFIDDNDNDTLRILVTYKDALNASLCLLQWESPYQREATFLGPGLSLCQGTPHGLTVSQEDSGTFLYHANNEQVVHKTRLDGTIVWSVRGRPPLPKTSPLLRPQRKTLLVQQQQQQQQPPPYAPTWMAVSPNPRNPHVYLADGYGSNRIFELEKDTGHWTGQVAGGAGISHGRFQTCHGLQGVANTTTQNTKLQSSASIMVVCDRENHRLEYFWVQDDNNDNNDNSSWWTYSHSESFVPFLVRPCMIRTQVVADEPISIVAALEGSVGLLKNTNGAHSLISWLNISHALAGRGFDHPHDAHLLPNGDFVLVTWNPGRIGYFRRLFQKTDDNNNDNDSSNSGNGLTTTRTTTR